jgi:hypothetical protein
VGSGLSLIIPFKMEIGAIRAKNQQEGPWMNVGPQENFTLKIN